MDNKQLEVKDNVMNENAVGMDAILASDTKYSLKKKKMFRSVVASAISLVVITVVLFSSRSLAYFSDNVGSEGNMISAGHLDIEMKDVNSESVTVQTAPIKVMPSVTVSKSVTIKNSGSVPVYLRVKVEKKVNDETGLSDGWENKISCNINNEHWTLKDGYYYYNHALKAGETTQALFSEVKFAASMGNEFVNKEIRLVVTSQATQTYNNGNNVFDAVGWPAEQ